MIGIRDSKSAETVRGREAGGEMHHGKAPYERGWQSGVEAGVAWQCKPSGSRTASN